MSRSQSEQRSYHHGDLRAALLKAAKEELAERGIEGFTLRSCARRADVSHAAPAHHFGDVTGLLTEVAIDAFEQLAASMRQQIDMAGGDRISRPIGAALGYVLFATSNPAPFKLMFINERLNRQRSELRQAASRAFDIAASAVAALYGRDDPMTDPVLVRRVMAFWSLAHGVASLFIAGQLGPIAKAERLTMALVPDMVRELFGEAAVDDQRDLQLIAKTAAQRGG